VKRLAKDGFLAHFFQDLPGGLQIPGAGASFELLAADPETEVVDISHLLKSVLETCHVFLLGRGGKGQ
jgi:hypothetical protein